MSKKNKSGNEAAGPYAQFVVSSKYDYNIPFSDDISSSSSHFLPYCFISLRSFLVMSLQVVFGFKKITYSLAFPNLLLLAELMKGGNNSNARRIGKRWTTPEKVNVIVVGIFSHSPCFKVHRITDLPKLRSSKVGPEVALKCFLI